MKLLFIIFFVTIVTLLLACAEGVVLMNFWNWFAVAPLSVPRLTYGGAIGLTFLISFIFQCNHPDTFKEKESSDDFISELLKRVIYSILALVVGYLVHLIL